MDVFAVNDDAALKKPLVVYDGDCGYCIYSVRYWRKLTGSSVRYQPYQDVASLYPDIPVQEFQRAVQYITPDGKVASGAEASFLTLSHHPGSGIWLRMYRKLPGFAYVSEKAYNVVSTHRNFFYTISKFCWGSDPDPTTYDMLTWIFLRLFGLIFLSAFYSFATQASGLIGSNGIIPAAEFLNAVYDQIGSQGYWLLPNVFWLNASNYMIYAVCWGGVIISILLILDIFPSVCLLFLYIFYLSLIYAGQVFMTFQWDMMLLEISIISLFLLRFRVLGIWLLRWMAFRFFFAAGIVKLTSGDPSWWDYTALDYHFLTQPLPTPLAWYAFYLPHSILEALTAATLIVEIPITFLFFFPRRIRFFAAFCVLSMQIGISLTGNYNFFNLTSMLLCLTMFDDAALRCVIPSRFASRMRQHLSSRRPYRITTLIAVVFAVLSITISIIQFNMRFIGNVPVWLARLNNEVAPLQMVNTYGPFAVMTKLRFEIIVEGSSDGTNWVEYNFKYKPGNIYRRPLWNIPFQPRLDWQMWFAALGPAEASPWFTRFLQKLLENSPEVTALLESNPFAKEPPVFVRALLYDYTYTTADEYKKTKAWWNRELIRVYFPAASL